MKDSLTWLKPSPDSVYEIVRDVNHSTLNRYFAFVVNWNEGLFQLPQLYKHVNRAGHFVESTLKLWTEKF
jgi:hypothetical protein